MTKAYADLAALDLTKLPCLSKGIDSYVYRAEDVVLKEYQRLSGSEVDRYVALQNETCRVLRETPYRAKINLDGVATELVAEHAIPVDWVGRSRNGRPLTISKCVEATNLEKLLWRPEMFTAYADAELSHPALREFAGRLNAYFWNEYPTRAQDELHYHVCMISRLLDEALGTAGLYISKYNVKLKPTPDRARIDLIVTDVALYIERVTAGRKGMKRSVVHAG
jgi:hypothetical protein